MVGQSQQAYMCVVAQSPIQNDMFHNQTKKNKIQFLLD